MFLRKLELHGFKSFAHNTTLEFQRGISAIVGPNGGGKSNIADALRFVLGEQSMKSIRSKKSEDLIFSGSATRGRMSMANVTLHFDNHDKAFPVDFESVIVQRKIFRDGENQYSINGAQVRLKDLAELIAKAKLGLKGYTIINQGMGDAILESSAKERKEIIFEALGLKEFQLKRADAMLKLSHTTVNLEKAEGIAREIEPHLKFLKKQAEKIEERHASEEKLAALERTYLQKRMRAVSAAVHQREAEASREETRIAELRHAIDGIAREIEEKQGASTTAFEGVSGLETSLLEEETKRNAIEREIGKVEGMIAAFRAESNKVIAINVAYVREQMEDLRRELASAMEEQQADAMREKLHAFAHKFGVLLETVRSEKVKAPQTGVDNSAHLAQETARLAELLAQSGERVRSIKEQTKNTYAAHSAEREKIFELKNAQKEKEHACARAEEQRSMVHKEIEELNKEKEVLDKEKLFLESKGAVFLIEDDGVMLTADEEEMRRSIERLRVRLENIDLIDENVAREHQDTQIRYDFLIKETEDLRQAISSLHEAIGELDAIITGRFREAFKKINENFQKYFSLLFEGGSARIEVVDNTQEETEEEEEGEKRNAKEEYGVDIEVTLPRKKASGLAVMSGGERALTSLALLFALVSTAPPPFLVLDEIDAPLDEANSLRYGKMLHELKAHTQFVVITHNRETMRQADVLYGVTMQEDGVSKLLSMKFETMAGTV
ncbi:AAA family ATPase [Candidatus Azambacteria bacterium]|nr:AAA family ATPase [Candidatus Azambacteria bacterium]